MPNPTCAPQRKPVDSRLRESLPSQPNACLFEQTVRVYLEDTDAGGIVYHASWLRFFERARTDWLRALGIEQSRLTPAEGLNFVVRDMQVEFLRPARLDQLVSTELCLIEARPASLRLHQQARAVEDGKLFARAQVRVAAVRLSDGRPSALPKSLINRLPTTLWTSPGELSAQ